MFPPDHHPSASLRSFHFDDDSAWRATVTSALSTLSREVVAGEARPDERGFNLCRAHAPDIIVTELWWRDRDAFAAVEALARLPGRPRVLALTARCDEVALHRATDAGLAGFVWKTSIAPVQLGAAFAALVAGRDFFPPEVLQERRRVCAAPTAYFKMLTPAERALLPRFGQGLSDKEISLQVDQSPATVKWHRGEIMRRLGLHSTTDLVLWAMARGFVRPHLPSPPCLVAA